MNDQARTSTSSTATPLGGVLWVVGLLALLPGPAGGQVGSTVSRPGRESPPTYAEDIAPILQEHCQSCHRPGTLAPFSLMTYEDARRVAERMRRAVENRSMPPWPMDRTLGVQEFVNDPSLSRIQVATIGAWVDAGMPMGEVRELPDPIEWPDWAETWSNASVVGAPPDLVVDLPAVEVPAGGPSSWPVLEIPLSGLTEERWVRAVEIRARDPETAESVRYGSLSLVQDGSRVPLVELAPGKAGDIYPEDAGKRILPGATLRYALNVQPIGLPFSARLTVGVWLHPKGVVPQHETYGEVEHRADMSTGHGGYPGHAGDVPADADLMIPPRSKAMYQGHYVLDRPARIHSLRGQMNARGMYQVVQAVFPDGREEILNKLNWQPDQSTTFRYEEDAMPLLPKGTVLIISSIFDNTENNPHNPDPEQWVTGGSRPVDETSKVWLGMTFFDDVEEFERLVAQRGRRLTS